MADVLMELRQVLSSSSESSSSTSSKWKKEGQPELGFPLLKDGKNKDSKPVPLAFASSNSKAKSGGMKNKKSSSTKRKLLSSSKSQMLDRERAAFRQRHRGLRAGTQTSKQQQSRSSSVLGTLKQPTGGAKVQVKAKVAVPASKLAKALNANSTALAGNITASAAKNGVPVAVAGVTPVAAGNTTTRPATPPPPPRAQPSAFPMAATVRLENVLDRLVDMLKFQAATMANVTQQMTDKAAKGPPIIDMRPKPLFGGGDTLGAILKFLGDIAKGNSSKGGPVINVAVGKSPGAVGGAGGASMGGPAQVAGGMPNAGMPINMPSGMVAPMPFFQPMMVFPGQPPADDEQSADDSSF
ncbi:unnamed protein product [Amoebophrya sp. A25]|nr:unnamed protein product [Amoebophrya sp. A25]|eukprot:GSA25T00017942001.1